MNASILDRIDSMNESKRQELTLELNPLKPKLKHTKIYQVISDMFNTKFIEHDVVDVIDGKTKYNPKTNTLTQSIRYILSGGEKIDIFPDSPATEEYTKYERNGKLYDLVNCFMLNKQSALHRLGDENYRLLIQELTK